MEKNTKNKFSGGKKLITGNRAMAEAAVRAGCRFYAGYPITPQNELTASMAKLMNDSGGTFIQAESEVAAINMVFGASATGFRAMTSSSSPGISLKQEGISYMAGAELPAVIINVMRAGPGLGNITPAQSDYFQATKGGGHGDYRLIVLAPSGVSEAYELTRLGFDLADQYRNPVMILADAYLGQMAEPVQLDFADEENKAEKYDKSWALTGAKNRKPNIIRSLLLEEGALEKHNAVLQNKFREIEKKEKRFEEKKVSSAEILFVAYGSSFRLAEEAALALRGQGQKVGLFRPVTLWPFPDKALYNAAQGKKAVFVFELSSGQMVEDVKLSLNGTVPVHFFGRTGGGVFSVQELMDFVKKTIK